MSDRQTAGVHRPFNVDHRDRWAWLAAIVLYVVGDISTTAVGLNIGAVETNPAALALFEAVGLWPAMLLLKAVVMALLGVLWVCSPEEWRVVVPATLSVVGAVVVANNGHVLALLVLDSCGENRSAAVEVLVSLGVVLA